MRRYIDLILTGKILWTLYFLTIGRYFFLKYTDYWRYPERRLRHIRIELFILTIFAIRSIISTLKLHRDLKNYGE